MFKRAELEDSQKLRDWIEQYYAYDHIDFHREILETQLPQLLSGDYGCAYFIVLDGQTVGYFILADAFDLEFGGRHGILTDFFFKEGQRRSGLGTKTLHFIESLCLAKNFSYLQLQVEMDNEEAKAFYQKSKFTTLTRNILIKPLGVSYGSKRS